MKEPKTNKSALAQTSPFPIGLNIDRAKGSYIYDVEGNAFLDFASGIAVSALGHGNTKITEAIKKQVDKHLHVMVYGEFHQKAQIELGTKLTSFLPNPLDQVYFVNSGTEANEGALKLAKRYTGLTEIISFKNSYHGSTHGSLSVSGNESKKFAFRPLLPDVKFIEFNDIGQLQEISEKTACVIMETIQGDAGVRIPSTEFMRALRIKCTETKTLLILDEIQCGMGRTGFMFAFQRFGIVPDILTLGKALGSGMPMGAFIAPFEIMNALSNNPPLGHITTFGGHPVACAAALAGLEILKEEEIIKNVENKGALLETLLQHVNIVELRRIGLLFAIELSSPTAVQKVVKYCHENGVLSFWFLSCPESFRIAPPLNISNSDIKKGAEIIVEALDRL